MYYPFSLLSVETAPLFGNFLVGNGVHLSLSEGSPLFDQVDISDPNALQAYAEAEMQKANTNWGFSEFGENREYLFKQNNLTGLVSEERFHHLGLDIWVPVGTPLFAPLAGEVVVSMYEEGVGNYGGMVVLKHNVLGQTIYSLYGHLNRNKLPELGSMLNAGDHFAEVANMDSNGGYFIHTQLQLLTQRGFDEGFVHKGNAHIDQFQQIENWCLNPTFLFIRQ